MGCAGAAVVNGNDMIISTNASNGADFRAFCACEVRQMAIYDVLCWSSRRLSDLRCFILE